MQSKTKVKIVLSLHDVVRALMPTFDKAGKIDSTEANDQRDQPHES